MREITVHLPTPHPKQRAFLRSPSKRRVICAGRRGGKTTGASIFAAEQGLAGRRVLEAAPTATQTDAFWGAVKRYCQPLLDAKLVTKNETDRSLTFWNGGYIRCKTAWNADTLRGDYADVLILDEYSLMDPDAWDEVGAPMLLDNGGTAVFIFTPKRRNHAYRMWVRAMTEESERWQAWKFTSHDNPHLDAEALADISGDMTDAAYRQEIMAEFLESEGAVFHNLDRVLTATPRAAQAHANHMVIAGIDWGKTQDYTAASVFCKTCREELHLARFNRLEYPYQQERLRTLYDSWFVKIIWAESNSMGAPVIDAMRRAGFRIESFATTAQSKPPLIESLALAFEREEARWLPDAIGRTELEAYESTLSAQTGRVRYGAPDGVHDDTVMARALAWHGANQYAGRRASSGEY
jgi:hypothetical protein